MKLKDFIEKSKSYPYYWRSICANYNYKGGKAVNVEKYTYYSWFINGKWVKGKISKGFEWYNKRHFLSPLRLFFYLINRYVTRFFQKRVNPIYWYYNTYDKGSSQ